MTKRTLIKRERNKKDFYKTPIEPVMPLLPFLKPNTLFIEPCCGRGDLIGHLESFGHHCVYASDIESYNMVVDQVPIMEDATNAAYPVDQTRGIIFITNPPWSRVILHDIIVNLSDQAPTWLLFDADWIHTKQAIPYLDRISKIISVGRVEWFKGEEDSKGAGLDNAAWYLFDKPRMDNVITLIGRSK